MTAAVPLPGAAAELTAVELEQLSAELQRDSIDRETQWTQLERDATGAAFREGFARLLALHSPLPLAAAEIGQVSGVLAQVAELLSPWEDMARRVLPLLEWAGDYSLVATAILRQVRAAGDLLDFVCAREIEALCTDTVAPPARTLADFDGLPAAAVHELQLATAPATVRELATANPDLTLLEVGEGHLVAAIGDIDTADSVTTVVSGVGSSEQERWPGKIQRIRTIAQATGGAGVLWLGYRAPDNVVSGIAADPAERGGRDLREFQEALAERDPRQHRTVIGHSYGSVVLGAAASPSDGPGLAADTAVLLGSPGVGVSRASQLQLVGGPDNTEPRVIAVTGSQDPIGLTATALNGVHGVDPAWPGFGAEVWPSDSDHTGYWEDPAFLRRLGGLGPE